MKTTWVIRPLQRTRRRIRNASPDMRILLAEQSRLQLALFFRSTGTR
jgi:hypothetical protein